jgi:hypothetical protein
VKLYFSFLPWPKEKPSRSSCWATAWSGRGCWPPSLSSLLPLSAIFLSLFLANLTPTFLCPGLAGRARHRACPWWRRPRRGQPLTLDPFAVPPCRTLSAHPSRLRWPASAYSIALLALSNSAANHPSVMPRSASFASTPGAPPARPRHRASPLKSSTLTQHRLHILQPSHGEPPPFLHQLHRVHLARHFCMVVHEYLTCSTNIKVALLLF